MWYTNPLSWVILGVLVFFLVGFAFTPEDTAPIPYWKNAIANSKLGWFFKRRSLKRRLKKTKLKVVSRKEWF